MARNIKWSGTFKSLSNVTCRVNIYANDWPEGVVGSVTLADDPFFFDEEDSSDLLNGVLRYKTGYIRIVETGSYGALSDIYPTNIFDRYVEVLYGNTVVFNGYIKVQDFSNELVPAPRILEFPVVSPLGLLSTRTFNGVSYLPPSEVSLGEALDTALVGMPYTKVYLPANMGYPNTVGLWMKISSLVIAPWNSDYHHSMNTAPLSHVAKGQTHEYIIDAICKAFGWICHDTPDALIFSAFDYVGDYCYYPVGHIGESGYSTIVNISSSSISLTDYFTPADDSAKEQTLMPETGISISFEGDGAGDRTYDFGRTYVPQTNPVVVAPSFVPDGDAYPNHAEIFSICNLLPVPGLYESDVQSTAVFNNDDTVQPGVYSVAWDNQTGFLVSCAQWATGHHLFSVRFYIRRRTGQKYSLSYDMKLKKNGVISALHYSPDEDTDYYVSAGLTYGDNYIQANFSYRWQSDPSPSVYDNPDYPQLPSCALIFISNIRLEICEQGLPYKEYLYKPASDDDVIPSTGSPSVSAEITMPISLYRLNDNLIGTSVRSAKLTEYPYLFQPRKQLVSKFRISLLLELPYIRKFSYMNKSWRIIAQKFRPWDDECELTMQYSPIL